MQNFLQSLRPKIDQSSTLFCGGALPRPHGVERLDVAACLSGGGGGGLFRRSARSAALAAVAGEDEADAHILRVAAPGRSLASRPAPLTDPAA
jgi:hypothetical protein